MAMEKTFNGIEAMAEILEPMIEDLFGNEYEPYEEKEDE